MSIELTQTRQRMTDGCFSTSCGGLISIDPIVPREQANCVLPAANSNEPSISENVAVKSPRTSAQIEFKERRFDWVIRNALYLCGTLMTAFFGIFVAALIGISGKTAGLIGLACLFAGNDCFRKATRRGKMTGRQQVKMFGCLLVCATAIPGIAYMLDRYMDRNPIHQWTAKEKNELGSFLHSLAAINEVVDEVEAISENDPAAMRKMNQAISRIFGNAIEHANKVSHETLSKLHPELPVNYKNFKRILELRVRAAAADQFISPEADAVGKKWDTWWYANRTNLNYPANESGIPFSFAKLKPRG